MTTPTGQISLSDVRLEIYGSAAGQIDMQDINVTQLAGVANLAQVSMSQLKGQTWSCSFVPVSGSYSNLDAAGTGTSTYVFNTSKYATWTYTLTAGSSTGTTVSVASGGISNSITFTAKGSLSSSRDATWSITATAGKLSASYTLHLAASSTGGGTTVTL